MLTIKHSVTDQCIVIDSSEVWVKILPDEMLGLLRWLVNDYLNDWEGSTYTLNRKHGFSSVVFYRNHNNDVFLTHLPDPKPCALSKANKYDLISKLAEKLMEI